MRGWEKIFHANRHDRKAGVAILISDKIDFNTKDIKKDKEGHYLMIKGIYPRRGCYYHQHICHKYRITQIHTTNINRHKGRNRWEYNHSRRL